MTKETKTVWCSSTGAELLVLDTKGHFSVVPAGADRALLIELREAIDDALKLPAPAPNN